MILTDLYAKVLLDIFEYLDLIDAINFAGTCVKTRDVAQLHYKVRYPIFNLHNFLKDRDQMKRHNYVDATIVLKSIGHVISVLIADLDETKIGSDLSASIRRYCTHVKSLKIVESRRSSNPPCVMNIDWLKNRKLEKITLGELDLMLVDLSEANTLTELAICWPFFQYDCPDAPCVVKRILGRNCNITSLTTTLVDGFDYESFAKLASLKCIRFNRVRKGTLSKVAAKLKMSNLEKVELDCNTTSDIKEINAFLATLAENALKLKELTVDLGTGYLAGGNPLPSLRLFELTSLSLMVDYRDLYKEIPKIQPNLKHLDLFMYCNIKPEHQIVSLIKNLDKLEIFHIDMGIFEQGTVTLKALREELDSHQIWKSCSSNRPVLRICMRHDSYNDFVQVKLNFNERKFAVTDIPFRRNYFSDSIQHQSLLPCCY